MRFFIFLFLSFQVKLFLAQVVVSKGKFVNQFNVDSLISNGIIYKYCSDCDSINPQIFFVSGYSIRVDSSRYDSTVKLNLARNPTKNQSRTTTVNFLSEREGYHEVYKIKYKTCCLNRYLHGYDYGSEISLPRMPFDSLLRIHYSDSTSFTCLIIPYDNFFHKEINFSFPFYKEGPPLMIRSTRKKDVYKILPLEKTKHSKNHIDKPNYKECNYAYKYMSALKQIDSIAKRHDSVIKNLINR